MSSSSIRDVAIFGVELPCRPLVTVGKPEALESGSNENFVHRFAVGTASARGGNSINLLEYQEGRKVAECAAVFTHPYDVLSLEFSHRLNQYFTNSASAASGIGSGDASSNENTLKLNDTLSASHKTASSAENDRYLVATIHPATNTSSQNPVAVQLAKKLFLSGQRETSFWDIPDTVHEGLHEFRPISTLPLDAVSVHFFKTSNSSNSAAFENNNHNEGDEENDNNINNNYSQIKAFVITRLGDVAVVRFKMNPGSPYETAEIESISPLDFSGCCGAFSSTSASSIGSANKLISGTSGGSGSQGSASGGHNSNSSNNSCVITACCWSNQNNNKSSSPVVTTCYLGVASSMTAITSHLVKVDLPTSVLRGSNEKIPSESITLVSKNAHAGTIRKIVNSVGRLHTILTGGDDGFVKGWDIFPLIIMQQQSSPNISTSTTTQKQPNLELFSFSAHNHFVYDISINEDHPELILTCGADRCTRLWRAPILSAANSPSSIANSPSCHNLSNINNNVADGTISEAGSNKTGATTTSNAAAIPTTSNNNLVVCVRSTTTNMNMYEGSNINSSISNNNTNIRDTVNSVQWSGTWVYASCSFDGGVHVDQVPFEMRSQLLLSM